MAPYFSYTRHLMIPDLLVMNTATLKGMSEEDQQTLKDLCKEYTEREFQLWDENLEGAIKTAEEAGVFSLLMWISLRSGSMPACYRQCDNEERGRKGIIRRNSQPCQLTGLAESGGHDSWNQQRIWTGLSNGYVVLLAVMTILVTFRLL